MRTVIRQRLDDLTNRHSHPISVSFVTTECIGDILAGNVYRLGEIAKLWKCSHEFVRRQFVCEPGVLRSRGMYLVPRCVVERVITRLMVQ